jgi:hypothetical protein
MKTNIHFWLYLAEFFLEWEMFQIKVVDKIKTHILYSITLFSKIVLSMTMWKNILEPSRLQTTIWHMRILCWIPKATITRSGYVIIINFPLLQWLHERASMIGYTYIALLVKIKYCVMENTAMWCSSCAVFILFCNIFTENNRQINKTWT